MSKSSPLFDVDPKGFRQVFAERPLHRLIEELIANVFDEAGATRCEVLFTSTPPYNRTMLTVRDNSPEGFVDLADSWTIFAPSKKKGDKAKRGRFNFGEKWVIARCDRVSITSTTGTVIFDVAKNQRTVHSLDRTHNGTEIECTLRTTKAELTETSLRVKSIIPPALCELTFNGETIYNRNAVTLFATELPTVVEGEEGQLQVRTRETSVVVYPKANERAFIYELGIPVCVTDDVYDVDVRQRIPLDLKRNVVKETYLRKLRGAVLTHTAHLLTAEQAKNRGVRDGLATASPEAVSTTMTKLFGEKRYIIDPSDMEAGRNLTADGYTAISGGTFDAETWQNIKQSNAAAPAGAILPTPQPYSAGGRPEKLVPPEKVTDGMRRVKRFVEVLAQRILLKSCQVRFALELTAGWSANCGPQGPGQCSLTFNVAHLGYAWFNDPPLRSKHQLDLIIHELGHHAAAGHLSTDYHDQLTRIGAALAVMAADECVPSDKAKAMAGALSAFQ